MRTTCFDVEVLLELSLEVVFSIGDVVLDDARPLSKMYLLDGTAVTSNNDLWLSTMSSVVFFALNS